MKGPPARGISVLRQQKRRKVKQNVDVESFDTSYAPSSVTDTETESDSETEVSVVPASESASSLMQPVPSGEVSQPFRSCKRQCNEGNWKQNVRKRLRQSGTQYTAVKGRQHAARSVKPIDCSSCTAGFIVALASQTKNPVTFTLCFGA